MTTVIRNGYLAYARYQGIAERAATIYLANRQPIWADIQHAAVALSLTEATAFLPEGLMTRILGAPEWAYPAMEQDLRAGADVWRQVTEEFYWEALEVLPPIYLRGGFMVSEPHSQAANGETFAAFVELGRDPYPRQYYACYCTIPDFPAKRDALLKALEVTP